MPEKILKITDPEFGDIYISVDELTADQSPTTRSGGYRNVNRSTSSEESVSESTHTTYIEEKGALLMDSIKGLGKAVKKAALHCNPDEIELKAGMNLKFSEGKLVAYFVQASTEFPIQVTMKWKNNNSIPGKSESI